MNVHYYLLFALMLHKRHLLHYFEVDIYLDTIALIRTSAFNDGILRIIRIIGPRPPEPCPGVLGVHGEVLLVLVSAVKRSIGFTTGFPGFCNHGEGPN